MTTTKTTKKGLKVSGIKTIPIKINLSQLENILFNVSGVTFIGAKTTTIPDMNKGGRNNDNYMYENVVKNSTIRCMLGFDYENRKNKIESQNWLKDTILAAQIAGVPDEIIQKSMDSLKEYSEQSLEKFVAKERGWGKHMINPHTGKTSRIMLDHTKSENVKDANGKLVKDANGKNVKRLLPETYKRYMQVEILGADSPEYVYKDSGKLLSDDDMDCVKKYLKDKSADDIVIRDYAIENINSININKAKYTII